MSSDGEKVRTSGEVSRPEPVLPTVNPSAEKSEPPMVETCREIIKNVVWIGVEEEDLKRTWLADAEDTEKRGSIEAARAILDYAANTMPGKKSIWRKYAEFENAHGTPDRVEQVYILIRYNYCTLLKAAFVLFLYWIWFVRSVTLEK